MYFLLYIYMYTYNSTVRLTNKSKECNKKEYRGPPPSIDKNQRTSPKLTTNHRIFRGFSWFIWNCHVAEWNSTPPGSFPELPMALGSHIHSGADCVFADDNIKVIDRPGSNLPNCQWFFGVTHKPDIFVNRCFSAPSVEEILCGVSVNSSFVMLWCYGTSQPFSLCSADKLRTHRETEPNKKTLTEKNNDSSGVNFLVYPRKVPHSASDCASVCIASPYVEKAKRCQTPLVFAVDFYSKHER